MNIEELREYCISKKGVTEHFPFDNDTLVFKVMGKMFIMIPLDRWENGHELSIVKLDPEWALELRDSYEGVIGGFQQGRKPDARYVHAKHWNTIVNNSDISKGFQLELINHSYDLVVKGLTKKIKEELKNL
ncbi:MAG: MmcQ/YjbR family DNA-binding protein [Flavobacteriaceae bacterium]